MRKTASGASGVNYDVNAKMNAAEDSGMPSSMENLSQYHDMGRYQQMNADVRSKATVKRYSIVIAVCIAVCVACTAYIAFMFNTPTSDASTVKTIENASVFAATDEDVEMLAAEGYDAETLTGNVDEFMKAFFTFDQADVEDGSWQASFEKYTVSPDEYVPIMENLLYTRTAESLGKIFETHPYYLSKLVSDNSITWHVMPTDTVNVPYCDVYATVDCAPLDYYELNSPALEINRYLNCYRIVFDENGKITSIKKLRSLMREEAVDQESMEKDLEYAEKVQEVERKKAETAAKEKAAAEEAERARAEAEAAEEARKAEEEAKKAQEEEDRKAQEEANKNQGSSSNTNSNMNTGNTNTGTNTGDNTNTGGNTNGSTGSGNENSYSFCAISC